MNAVDSLIMKEDAKYILATEYLQGMTDHYGCSICSTAVVTLQGYEDALKHYADIGIKEYNHIYIKEFGVYRNLTTEDAEDKEFLNFFREAANLHKNEKVILKKFKEKYINYYFSNNLKPIVITNKNEDIKDNVYCLIAVMKELLLDIELTDHFFQPDTDNSKRKPAQTALAQHIAEKKINGLGIRNINGILAAANRAFEKTKE